MNSVSLLITPRDERVSIFMDVIPPRGANKSEYRQVHVRYRVGDTYYAYYASDNEHANGFVRTRFAVVVRCPVRVTARTESGIAPYRESTLHDDLKDNRSKLLLALDNYSIDCGQPDEKIECTDPFNVPSRIYGCSPGSVVMGEIPEEVRALIRDTALRLAEILPARSQWILEELLKRNSKHE